MSGYSSIRSFALKWSGALLILVSIILMVVATQVGDFWFSLSIVAIGLILATRGNSLVKKGKQYHSREMAAKALRDSRSPIVYLRAFKDDELMSKSLVSREGLFRPSIFTAQLNLVSQEERMAKAMARIGPFLALGRSEDELPPLGAIRLYGDDEHWHENILKLLKRARLVTIRAGVTKSLMWELKEARKFLRPQQLVFLVPNDRDSYDKFRIAPTVPGRTKLSL